MSEVYNTKFSAQVLCVEEVVSYSQASTKSAWSACETFLLRFQKLTTEGAPVYFQAKSFPFSIVCSLSGIKKETVL